MITFLIVLAVLVLLGVIPAWPHSRSWGYGPSGGLGLILVIVLILLLTGRLSFLARTVRPNGSCTARRAPMPAITLSPSAHLLRRASRTVRARRSR
jgi:Protein of unknown function (DUF3309)